VQIPSSGGIAQAPTGSTGVNIPPASLPSQGSSGGSSSNRVENPLKGNSDTLGEVVGTVANDIVLPVGGSVVVLMIIYSGFLFVTAQGVAAKILLARQSFFWTGVGALVLLGAWSIAQVLATTINTITGQ
jgi:hypothetical protein